MFINLPAVITTTTTNTTKSDPNQILMLVLWVAVFGAIMYFLIIRPKKKKEKTEAKMRDSLAVGDEIVTIGGIMGRVVSIKEDSIILESGPDKGKQRFARWAIQQNLTVHEELK